MSAHAENGHFRSKYLRLPSIFPLKELRIHEILVEVHRKKTTEMVKNIQFAQLAATAIFRPVYLRSFSDRSR
jgi:hypothetical protein